MLLLLFRKSVYFEVEQSSHAASGRSGFGFAQTLVSDNAPSPVASLKSSLELAGGVRCSQSGLSALAKPEPPLRTMMKEGQSVNIHYYELQT